MLYWWLVVLQVHTEALIKTSCETFEVIVAMIFSSVTLVCV